MSNSTTKSKLNKVLFLGAGPNDFGIQGENDAAIYQVLPELHGHGYQVFVVDDNPYSVALESVAATTFWEPLTVTNIKKIIKDHQIDAVAPLFGGHRALRLWNQILNEWHTDDGQIPRTLGLDPTVLRESADITQLNQLLIDAGLPVIQSQVAKSQTEVNELMRSLSLPLVIRANNPVQSNTRQIVERLDDLDRVVDEVKSQSLLDEVLISKAINGMKEVSLEVLRDYRGNCLQVGASEDMDPIGIHTADSLSVSPVLTVQDRFMEQMRSYAFQVADLLQLQGALHLQFAVSEITGKIYIIKIAPYIDQMATRMALVTGYPMLLVAMYLSLGQALEEVVLPHNFHPKTAMMEPMMDHIAVKLPVFPFGDLHASGIEVDRNLSSIQKSVGSTIGFGRTFIEALEKAIRSAHFNNRGFSPTYMEHISDDELIQQLIHPQDNRVLLFIEAIRRGYEVDELTELSRIDAFYFYQLKHLIALEQTVENQIDNPEILLQAKVAGLSDGLIARFWHSDFQSIRRLARQNDIRPTYKALEPSAGEFPENAHQYYATFETEDESTPLGKDSILVVGSGAFRLGESASGGYATAIILSELRRLQYHTVAMNNNSSDATLLPHISDKQYLEPLEISDVMAVVDKENPQAIMVPGNRKKLIKALEELGQRVLILPREKHLANGPEAHESEFSLNFFYDGVEVYPLIIGQHRAGEMRLLNQSLNLEDELNNLSLPSPGLYQIIWRADLNEWVSQVEIPDLSHDAWLRPVSYGQVAYLSKAMGIHFLRLIVRAMLDELTPRDWEMLQMISKNPPHVHQWMAKAMTNYQLHLQPSGAIDTTRFEMGVRVVNDEQ